MEPEPGVSSKTAQPNPANLYASNPQATPSSSICSLESERYPSAQRGLLGPRSTPSDDLGTGADKDGTLPLMGRCSHPYATHPFGSYEGMFRRNEMGGGTRVVNE